MFDVFEFFNNPDFFAVNTQYAEVKKCPVCNMSYQEFRHTGKLGCSECYRFFGKALGETLRRVHRNPVHNGKIPGNLRAKLSVKKQLAELKTKLQDAVRNEKYEEAAAIHKEILEMEKGCR